MPRCKAPEVLMSEAYWHVRRNDEGRGERRRWAFFASLLKFINAIELLLRAIKNISTRGQFLLPEEPRQPIILCCKTGGIIELLLRFQRGSPQIEQIVFIKGLT